MARNERVDRIVRQFREGVYRGDIGETDIAYLIAALQAAEQAQVQAAPVLAAAEEWVDTPGGSDAERATVVPLCNAVAAWRAAREG